MVEIDCSQISGGKKLKTRGLEQLRMVQKSLKGEDFLGLVLMGTIRTGKFWEIQN